MVSYNLRLNLEDNLPNEESAEAKLEEVERRHTALLKLGKRPPDRNDFDYIIESVISPISNNFRIRAKAALKEYQRVHGLTFPQFQTVIKVKNST